MTTRNLRKYSVLPLIFLIIVTSIPICNANVWISPMKMLAEGEMTQNGTIEIRKNISLRNDENCTYIITLQAIGINVSFEKQTIELLPYEKRIIQPIILVELGNHTGSIIINTQKKDKTSNQTGSSVISNIAITVTTRGFEQISTDTNNKTIVLNQLPNQGLPLAIVIISIIIVSFIIFFVFLYKRQIMIFANKKDKKPNHEADDILELEEKQCRKTQ